MRTPPDWFKVYRTRTGQGVSQISGARAGRAHEKSFNKPAGACVAACTDTDGPRKLSSEHGIPGLHLADSSKLDGVDWMRVGISLVTFGRVFPEEL